ncbi:hypothetical protein J1605_022776 [Eschrichtius robustus]|uniref:Uncharacterized protein n=1 Tax=Eschrichtius robustus TaxID=9764 RepID=A0AB34HA13_ESCRO|nr:hypothetical protein J1605_022776 [Eschrichtius robustus]
MLIGTKSVKLYCIPVTSHKKKTASLQFAECQDIIQCQEQESVRLKLQHTLDVKVDSYFAHMYIVFQELKGPGYTSNSSVKPHLLQPSSAAHSHSNVPSSQSAASFLSHVSN